MTPLYIDSAYVIALVNRRDRYHLEAESLARQHKNREFITTDAVLFEIGNALARQFRTAAGQIFEQFLNAPEVEIVYTSPQRLEKAVALYKQMADKQWSLVDCLSFEIMRERDIQEALTPDHHFTQAGYRTLFATS